MSYRDTTKRLTEMRDQIARLRDEMRKTQAEIEPEPVENYTFATPDGPVRLDDLFGGKDTLFVIHNMGASCRFCTLWADGFNGVLPHLESRAADMGYRTEKSFQPGVSVFKKQKGKIVRVSDQGLGPYDDFCSVWHFFDMMPEGAGDWSPQYKY